MLGRTTVGRLVIREALHALMSWQSQVHAVDDPIPATGHMRWLWRETPPACDAAAGTYDCVCSRMKYHASPDLC